MGIPPGTKGRIVDPAPGAAPERAPAASAPTVRAAAPAPATATAAAPAAVSPPRRRAATAGEPQARRRRHRRRSGDGTGAAAADAAATADAVAAEHRPPASAVRRRRTGSSSTPAATTHRDAGRRQLDGGSGTYDDDLGAERREVPQRDRVGRRWRMQPCDCGVPSWALALHEVAVLDGDVVEADRGAGRPWVKRTKYCIVAGVVDADGLRDRE